jgi:hypothetical protein
MEKAISKFTPVYLYHNGARTNERFCEAFRKIDYGRGIKQQQQSQKCKCRHFISEWWNTGGLE